MDLSVIIVTWNSEKDIVRCLRSVFACAEGLNIEVIVVDNASSDETKHAIEATIRQTQGDGDVRLSASKPDITVIRNSNNKGFAAANNQGLVIAKGDFILLLNPDTELVAASLAETVLHMRANPDTGIVGCKLLNFDGSPQPSVRRFPSWRDQSVILLKLHNFFPKLVARYMAADFDYGKEQEVDQVRGAYLCLSRRLLEKIGPLDERNFFIWFEEVDYCRRAKNSGFKVMYLPSAVCRHEGGASFGQALSFAKQRWLIASLKKYFRKHGTTADRLAVALLAPFSLAIAWGVEKLKIKPRKYV
jgi:GT2 family glycosyltransferase